MSSNYQDMCNTAGNHYYDNDVRILIKSIRRDTKAVFGITNDIC